MVTNMKKVKLIVGAIILILIVMASWFSMMNSRSRLKAELQDYLDTYFPNQKLIGVFSVSVDDLAKFAITQAMSHGMVYKAEIKNGNYVLKKDMLQENISQIFGNRSLIIRMDLNKYVSVNEKGECLLRITQPEHNYIYVIHKIKKDYDMFYTATLTYIDTFDGIYTYSQNHEIIPIENIVGNSSTLATNDKLAILQREILRNPDHFEKVEFRFTYSDGIFYYWDAE